MELLHSHGSDRADKAESMEPRHLKNADMVEFDDSLNKGR